MIDALSDDGVTVQLISTTSPSCQAASSEASAGRPAARFSRLAQEREEGFRPPLARFSHLAQSISSKRPGSKKMPARSSRLAQVAEEALPCSGALYSPCVRCQRARAAFRLVFLNLHIARKEKSGYLGWFFSSCAQRRGLGCRSAQPPHAQGEKNPQNWPKMARFSCSKREKRATPRGCGLRSPTPSALRPRWQRPPARR